MMQTYFLWLLFKPEGVKKIIESIPSSIQEDIMTTYTRIAQENIQIGIQKKQTEVILKSFDHGISIPMISEITGLSIYEVHEILKKQSVL